MGMMNNSSNNNNNTGITALPGMSGMGMGMAMGGAGVPAQSPSAAANAALEAALSGTAFGMAGAGAMGLGLPQMGGQVWYDFVISFFHAFIHSQTWS